MKILTILVNKKNTLLQKYGVENATFIEDHFEKVKNTNRQKRGVDWVFQSKDFKEKSEKTNLEKLGVKNAMQSDVVKEKRKQTLIQKEGSVKNFYTKVSQATKQTFIANDGSIENHYKKVAEKTRSTILQQFGKEAFFQTDAFKEKSKRTMKERYGVENISQTSLRSCKKLYTYREQHFDSIPELCFYIYHIENNLPIVRNPKKLFFFFKNKKRVYWLDFEVENQLFEIKGDQFLKEDDTWQNPFDHKKDALYEAKRQCALQNGVKILYRKDYKKYIDFVEEKYGKNFLKNFISKPVTLV